MCQCVARCYNNASNWIKYGNTRGENEGNVSIKVFPGTSDEIEMGSARQINQRKMGIFSKGVGEFIKNNKYYSGIIKYGETVGRTYKWLLVCGSAFGCSAYFKPGTWGYTVKPWLGTLADGVSIMKGLRYSVNWDQEEPELDFKGDWVRPYGVRLPFFGSSSVLLMRVCPLFLLQGGITGLYLKLDKVFVKSGFGSLPKHLLTSNTWLLEVSGKTSACLLMLSKASLSIWSAKQLTKSVGEEEKKKETGCVDERKLENQKMQARSHQGRIQGYSLDSIKYGCEALYKGTEGVDLLSDEVRTGILCLGKTLALMKSFCGIIMDYAEKNDKIVNPKP